MLGGVAVANHCLLDLHRLIGSNLQTCLPDGKENHATALGDPNAGGYILTEKQFFNSHRIGLCHLQKLPHILVNDLKTGRKIHACGGGDRTAAQE